MADHGVGFDGYNGLDSMFSITAPVTMTLAEVEQFITTSLPAVLAVDRNFVGSLGGSLGGSVTDGTGAGLNQAFDPSVFGTPITDLVAGHSGSGAAYDVPAGTRVGDIIPISGDPDAARIAAGEWEVTFGVGTSPAEGLVRSPELDPDPWLAGALAPLVDDGFAFIGYNGLDTMISITAPVTMTRAEVTQRLTNALPGVIAVDPEYVGMLTPVFADPAASATGIAPAGSGEGDIITILDGGASVQATAGVFLVTLGESDYETFYDGSIGSPATEAPRSPEVGPDPWLATALAPLAGVGIAFEGYNGMDSMFSITAPLGMPLEAVEQALSVVPGLLHVGRDYVGYLTGEPNDPLYQQQWHLENVGQIHPTITSNINEVGTSDADVDAETAWDYTVGGYSTVVAVLDSGMQYTHADLKAPRWRNQLEDLGNNVDDDGNGFVNDALGYDFVDLDRDPAEEPGGEFSGHGTWVAGVHRCRGRQQFVGLRDGTTGPCPATAHRRDGRKLKDAARYVWD